MVPSPSQPEEENLEHASMMENEAAHNITRQEKNSRHIKWSNEEEEMLISSWLTISNDSAVGNSQTRCSFWARVARYFNTYRKTKIEREESQIKSHYYLMMPQVNEFNGYYNQIVSDHHSGWSDTQIIQAARLNWKNAHKKREFPYTHVWEMVKDEPKWTAQVGTQNASKKTKTSDSGAYTSSSHHDQEDSTHEGNESKSRPIGQKAAKRKMRGKEKKDVNEPVAEEFDNHNAIEAWENTLIGKVKELKPNVAKIQGYARYQWGEAEHVRVSSLPNGLFLFNSNNWQDMMQIIMGWSWLFKNWPLMLKEWLQNTETAEYFTYEVTIWVKLPGLDPILWMAEALSNIDSALGRPIYSNTITSSKYRM
uniref:Myb-like domain-containing protein n=1 Tax=Kalanchoe fedtschenkoi TaxID=63787 RepID=A0A7N0SV38_KALFE